MGGNWFFSPLPGVDINFATHQAGKAWGVVVLTSVIHELHELPKISRKIRGNDFPLKNKKAATRFMVFLWVDF